MLKLRSEMDTMKGFRSILKKAKASNNTTPTTDDTTITTSTTTSSRTNTAQTTKTQTTNDNNSQNTEITEDEVLHYFETIYNFLDTIDADNTKLRNALDRIGRSPDSAGRPYSQGRLTVSDKTVVEDVLTMVESPLITVSSEGGEGKMQEDVERFLG